MNTFSPEPHSLAERIAGEIRHLAAGQAAPYFTTASRLAARFGVAYRTVNRAISILRSRGEILSIRGKGILIGRPDRIPPAEATDVSERGGNAAHRLALLIEDRIRIGAYKLGTAMPKNAHLAYSENVSASTCASAMKILERKNLIHKKGKKWWVGPRSSSREEVGPYTSHEEPVVYIFVMTGHSWYRIAHEKSFIWPFFKGLGTEFDRYGISRRLAVFDERHRPDYFPTAEEAVHSISTELGKRYAGSIFYAQYTHSRFDETLKYWIRRISRFGKPVALLDPCIRPRSLGPIRRADVGSQNYFRFYMNEEAGVHHALETLERLEHRRIGYTTIRHFSVAKRLDLLRRTCASFFPGIDLLSADQTDEFVGPVSLEPPRLAGLQDISRRLQKMYAPDPPHEEGSRRESLRARCIEAAPALSDLLDSGITALIAFNDIFARSYLRWLKYVNIAVPRQLSIISFDNIDEVSVYPLSTIDFGLCDLGYRAAHLFIGDFPVKTDDREGSISSTPLLFDRGSLGPPRKSSGAIVRAKEQA